MIKRFPLLTITTTAVLILFVVFPVAGEDKLAKQVDASAQDARDNSEADTSLLPGWLIDLSAGYSLSRGNSDTADFLARAAVIKKIQDTWQLIGKGEYSWGEVKDDDTGKYEKTADRGLLNGQINLFVIENGFLYGRSEISYDKIKKLDRRLENGIGAGYDIYRKADTFAAMEAGGAYIDSKYEDNQHDHGIFLRLAQNGALVINERVTLLESIEYKPKFEDFKDYLLNAEAALRVVLFSQLYFILSLSDRYDNSPASGTKRNDLSVISSLGISL